MRPRSAPHDDDLAPGAARATSESEWYEVLETCELLHQWGSALLVEERGHDALLRLWVRDDSPERRHWVRRLDAAATARARAGVAEVELAAERVADLLTEEQARGSSTPAQLVQQGRASEAYVDRADALYRELAVRDA